MRKVILAGNWKMHKTVKESIDFLNCVEGEVKREPLMILFPPFTSLYEVGKHIGNNAFIRFGAQNMHFEKRGAYTGEICAEMIIETGAKYVLIGHSERRHIFNENDSFINKKVLSALDSGLIPVLCVGETLNERQALKTDEVIRHQLFEGLKNVKDTEFIVAYEPVWAIGTGINATPVQASEVHKLIRDYLDEIFMNGKGERTTILYGGSVKVENIEELSKEAEIDGVLVGGASLDCTSFVEIWRILGAVKGIV